MKSHDLNTNLKMTLRFKSSFYWFWRLTNCDFLKARLREKSEWRKGVTPSIENEKPMRFGIVLYLTCHCAHLTCRFQSSTGSKPSSNPKHSFQRCSELRSIMFPFQCADWYTVLIFNDIHARIISRSLTGINSRQNA